MKEITIRLPEDVYFEYQVQAGKNRQETLEFITELLIQEVKDQTPDNNPSAQDVSFREFVLEWDWPAGDLRRGTSQADNVVGVVEKMAEGYEFTDALNERAKDARTENPDLGPRYHTTVRADCTKAGYGVTESASQFRREVHTLLQQYNQLSSTDGLR